jgi:hypothetical protein
MTSEGSGDVRGSTDPPTGGEHGSGAALVVVVGAAVVVVAGEDVVVGWRVVVDRATVDVVLDDAVSSSSPLHATNRATATAATTTARKADRTRAR